MIAIDQLQNDVNGGWRPTATDDVIFIVNPAIAETLAPVPISPAADVDAAAAAAAGASEAGRRSPGNMASNFTAIGAVARRFRNEVDAGNVGITIGVTAPMAHFPFSGWGESFVGALHAQGRHGVEFSTQTKVVVERWPDDWSRRF